MGLHSRQALSGGDLPATSGASSREALLCRAAVNSQAVRTIAKALLEEPSPEEVRGYNSSQLSSAAFQIVHIVFFWF
jgi:hypothetical protein